MGFTDKFSADRQRFSRNFSLEPAPNKETSGSRDRTIRLRDAATGKLLPAWRDTLVLFTALRGIRMECTLTNRCFQHSGDSGGAVVAF
jgi:hypothetical protein